MAAHQDHFSMQCCHSLHQGANQNNLTELFCPYLQHYTLLELMA